MLVLMNQREFTTESNKTRLSIIRFYHGQQESHLSVHHAYLVTLFQQDLIVLAERYAKNDRRDILKAMNPFLPFTPLPADIKHASDALANLHRTGRTIILYAQLAHRKPGFINPRRLRSSPEHVGFDRNIIGRRDSGYLVEETASG